jgi:hypothetical protein
MRRPTILAALVATFVIVAAAFALQARWDRVDDTAAAPGDVAPPAAAPLPSPSPAAPVAPRPADAGAPVATLAVHDAGSIERLEGQLWVPLAPGTALAVDDRIRTTGRGRSVLRAGSGDRIELVDEVEISVEALTRSLAELELHRGRLRAELAESSGVALRVRSSGATAEARAGAFMVFADGTGMVAVASETAEVRLRAADHEVTVGAGEQSVVAAGGPPSDPEEVPDEVLLRVAWPAERARRDRRLVVRGQAGRGAEVRVGSEPVAVGPDGAFETTVELDAGPNRVTVWARDPAGRSRAEESPEVVVRDRPPRLEVISPGGWGAEPR